MIIYKHMLKDRYQSLQANIARYMELPPPNKNGKLPYVLQYHIRGRSVSDRTPIVIREQDRIRVIPIKTLENREDLSSIEIWTSKGWKKLKRFYKHPPKRIYRVFTWDSVVEVTEDHSLFSNGQEIATKDLQKGVPLDEIPVPRLPLEVSVDLDYAYTWGLFLAEGSVKRDGTVKITTTDLEILRPVISYLERYGFNYHIVKSKKEGFKEITDLYFRDYRFTKGTVTGVHEVKERKARWKIIPDFIFNWNRESLSAFLDGYLKGDGIGYPEKIEFASSSQSLIQGILIILKNLYPDKEFYIRGQGDLIRVRLISKEHNLTVKNRNTVRKIVESKAVDFIGEKNPNYKDGKHLVNAPTDEETFFYSYKRYVYDVETETQDFLAGVGFLRVHNSVHIDFRFKIDNHLIGWTILDNGLEDKPDSKEEVKELVEKHDWKFTPNKKGVGLRAETKARQPVVWLDLGGRLKKIGDIVKIPKGSVGATRYEYGWFYLLDKGKITIGAQKPYFHEYFLDGEKFKKLRVVIRGVKAQKIDPETKKPIKGEYELLWRVMIPKDQEPYAVSKRARKKGWYPPKGHIPIPKWWIEENKKKYEEWLEWVKEKWKEEESLAKPRFSFSMIYWKGQKVIRDIPQRRWFIRIDDRGRGSVRSWMFEGDPVWETPLTAIYEGRVDRRWMKREGELKPRSQYCPTKEIPCHCVLLDTGTVDIKSGEGSLGEEILELKFNGKTLKGEYILRQEEPDSDIYTLSRISKHSLSKGIFVLDKHTLYPVRGQITSHYDIRMRIDNRDYLDEFNLYSNPLETDIEEPIEAVRKKCTDLKWITDEVTEGFVKVGKLQTKVDRLDKGEVEIIEDSDIFMSMIFHGKKLKGYYITKKTDKGWIFMKSKLPTDKSLSTGDPYTGESYKPALLEDHRDYFYLRLYDPREFTRCEDPEPYLKTIGLEVPEGVEIGVCLYPIEGTFHHARIAYLKFYKDKWTEETARAWMKGKGLSRYEWIMKRGDNPPEIVSKP